MLAAACRWHFFASVCRDKLRKTGQHMLITACPLQNAGPYSRQHKALFVCRIKATRYSYRTNGTPFVQDACRASAGEQRLGGERWRGVWQTIGSGSFPETSATRGLPGARGKLEGAALREHLEKIVGQRL